MVHAFKQGGQRIALDTASGAVHVLSALAYKMIDLLEPPLTPVCPSALRYDLAKYDSRDVDEAYDELYALYESGVLFSDDIKIPVPPIEYTPIKAMCLHIAHDCNMRCKYCFADSGDYHKKRTLMSVEVGCKALDFLIEKSGRIHNLEVDFFGGEPLMNFAAVKEIVLYGRELEQIHNKNIRFTMTTNASLLDDDSIAFLNEHCSNAVLSIDGMKSTNDNMRTFEDGSGTYDDIMPKIKHFIKARKGVNYYVRGTFTRNNLHFADDVLHLADEGFKEISVEPVVLPADDPLSLREEDLPVIFEEYEKLAKELVRREKEGNGFNFFHFMVDLDAGPCAYKRTKGCGSGCEYVAVTPEGDVYPCHQFVEHTEYKLGNIFVGDLKNEIRTEFGKCNIQTNDECRQCWAKYFCGGGCAANNFNQNGGLMTPYKVGCELEKKRVECSLYIKAALA